MEFQCIEEVQTLPEMNSESMMPTESELAQLQLQKIREAGRTDKNATRDRETYEHTVLRRAQEAQRQREKRAQESEEEAEVRRQKSALAKRLHRSQEEPEASSYRRAMEAERQRQRRSLRVMSETPEQKQIRKAAEAERQRLRRAKESDEQKAERRRKGAEAIAMRRWADNVQSSDLIPTLLQQEMHEFNLDSSSQYLINDVNVIYERYLFGSAVQEENETFRNFIERLKHLSINCGYQSMTDDLVRDRLIVGIRDDELRKIFLRNKFLTLQQAVAVCESIEASSNCQEAVQVKIEPDLDVYVSNPISVCESTESMGSNDHEAYSINVDPDLEVYESNPISVCESIETMSSDGHGQVKIEPDLEAYDSLSPPLLIPDVEIKEESCSPVHQEYIHAETIEIIIDDDEDIEEPIDEIDISFLKDVKTYAMLKDVPKYSCNICDATFFELKDLTVHIKHCKMKNL